MILNTVQCHCNEALIATKSNITWYCTHHCRCKEVQYNMILHTSLQLLRQSINQSLNPQKTPHISPYRASYGVYFVGIWEKIDSIIRAPHCVILWAMLKNVQVIWNSNQRNCVCSHHCGCWCISAKPSEAMAWDTEINIWDWHLKQLISGISSNNTVKPLI